MSASIGILGAGGWGTALALHLYKLGHQVMLWEYMESAVARIRRDGENKAFLPGISIPKEIKITTHLDRCLKGKDILLIALPSHVIRNVLEGLEQSQVGTSLIVSASKGIENHSLLRVSEVILQCLPFVSANRILVLSGPSHAEEVAIGIPTALTISSISKSASIRAQEVFMGPSFRVYTSQDIIGVELGGALKNVIALAAGICDGVGFGDNTKAALMTRGLAEMTRLGAAMSADPATFAGLAGVGDLFVTCTSRHSRNRYVGEQIGKGKTLHQVLDEMVMVVEGVRTTQSAVALAEQFGVDLPITQAVNAVLFDNQDPKEAVQGLMSRNPKAEDFG